MPSVEDQIRTLKLGVVDLVSEKELRAKLERGKPLRVKLGIDPSSPDIHLGHTVVLRKMRQFQELGHIAVLIVGDYTARVGDPSGQSATRPLLSDEEVDHNAKTYLDQVYKVLDRENLEVRRNSEWLAQMNLGDVLKLASQATVAQMLERDDFDARYKSGSPLSVMEFLYPLMVGWDSVCINADVELGGTDQLFNLLAGRPLQQRAGQEQQVVLTMPLLVGLDGQQKMSKSLGNYVGVTDPAAEMFGKLMSVPDELMPDYFRLTTGWNPDHTEDTLDALKAGRMQPVEAKRLLARTIVELYHGDGSGAMAEEEFDRVFKQGAVPEEVPEFKLPQDQLIDGKIRLSKVLALAGLVSSGKEGRRKIEQGGVRIDGERVEDPDLECSMFELNNRVLQVGKRAWARVKV